jgi:biopolymer transport protein ExbD
MPNLMTPPAAEPMRELNTTPLIDVMLVLLVMFLVALPVLTHKVPIELPPGGFADGAVPPTHRLSITPSGAIFWDDRPLPNGALGPRLRELAGDPALPMLEIAAASEARYERVDQILAEISRAGVTRLSFVDNRAFAESF